MEQIQETYNIENHLSEQKKDKIKSWLKDKHNLYFLAVMLFAIAIRLYYFFMTYEQPLWWDEAEYMSVARYWVFGTPYEISPQRLVLFPFLISLFYRIGFGELLIRFSIVIIPSILVVLVTYLFVKEMYNKRIALLTALITSVCWIHLFYSMRIMNDEISFLFGLLALWFFWKGYIAGKNNKLVYFSAFFITLSFMIRPTGIYYAVILILFLFVTERFKFLKKPQLWAMLLIFILTFSPHLIWSHFYHGNAFAFRSAYSGVDHSSMDYIASAKYMLKFVYDFPELIFFIFFLIGLLTLLPMFFNFDRLLKGNKKYYNDLLLLISILFIEASFIFMIGPGGENRWLMAMSLGIFVFSAKGILLVFDIVKKNFGKMIAVAVIIILISFGIYVHTSYDFFKKTKYSLEQRAQLNHADAIIKNKIESYAPVKEAGLWIKQNSNPGDVIFSRSRPQNTYYSDRETFTFDYSLDKVEEEQLLNLIKERKPKFFILSIFESHSEWMFQLPQKYAENFKPVQAYEMNGQPILVIYEVDYSNF